MIAKYWNAVRKLRHSMWCKNQGVSSTERMESVSNALSKSICLLMSVKVTTTCIISGCHFCTSCPSGSMCFKVGFFVCLVWFVFLIDFLSKTSDFPCIKILGLREREANQK